MTLMHDIQSSFAGGEIAPELHGRVDLAKYKISCKTLRNFLPSPRGPAYNRPGTYYVAGTKHDNKQSRLVPFVPSSTASYVLEFGDQYVRFYKEGSQILSGGNPYEVATPYLEADLPNLKFARSADTLYIVHPDHAPRTLQRISDDNWTLSLYAFKNGPFMFPNADTAKVMSQDVDGGGSFLSTNFDIFDPGHVGAQFQITQFVDADILHGSKSSTGVISYTTEVSGGYHTLVFNPISSLACGGGWRFRTHGTWTGKVALQKSFDDGVTWQNIQIFCSQSDVNFDTFGTESVADNNGNPFAIRANVISWTSGTVIVDLSADAFEVFTTVTVTSYDGPRKVYATMDSIFNPTSLWAEGSWSTYRGWPSAVGFFQDRLVFGATKTEPQTAWFTKTSNYVDFGRSIPLVDSDGITINLQSRQVNPIVTIAASLNTCVFFTGFSYWSVTSDSGGGITPTSIASKLQENRGINGVDPVTIGNRLLFIDGRGATIRDIEYQYLSDRYQSENISLSADHLFRGYTIVDMAYQQTPDSILWMVRSDGKLVSLTYLREQEVLAFARHDTGPAGGHSFESICTIPGTGVDEVWFIVLRGSKRFVERMLLRTQSTDPADQYFVDCGIGYSGAPTAALSGYDHLNGFAAIVNTEGFVLPEQTVSGGIVELDASRSKAQVGLSYTCDLETLNPEFPMQDGTLQGRKYQINKAVFRYYNTVGGYVGSDFDDLDATDMRTHLFPAIDAATPTPLFTGFDPYTIRPSYDSRDHVAYRQTDPMPVTILSILPLVSPGQTP